MTFVLTMAMVLGAVPFVPGSVLSVQADGPTVITADTKEWSGEMVVNEDVSINGEVKLTGDTTLTIADGKMLTLDGHITTQWSNGYGLTVNGSGRLKVNYSGNSSEALFARNFTVEGASVEVSNSAAGARLIMIGGASEGNFTISSGSVKVTDTDAQYGIYVNGSITISGGSVEVNVGDTGITGRTIAISAGVVSAKATSSGEYDGEGYGISGDEGITVTGGQVTASGARAGILMMGGSSAFGYSDADDFIDISGIEVSEGPLGPATIAIKDGQVLSDGTNFYDSTASSETIAALSNVKLVPAYAVNVASGITGGSISTNSYAAKGDNVTVTATPDEGNVLDTLTVTDAGSNSVQVSGDGNTRTFTMPEKEVTITAEFIGKTATPTFSPASGTTFTNTLNVTVSCATNGAKIYYTKDGSAPTTSSMEYTGTISVSETSTIKAIAVKDGMADSAVAEASYSKTSASGGESAVVTKAPTANTLAYTGSAQELVTAGTATGGEMRYALGNATETTQPYTTSIPTATDAGTYYVWYKVVGDSNHEDSTPESVSVTIEKAAITIPSGGGSFGGGGAAGGGSTGGGSSETPADTSGSPEDQRTSDDQTLDVTQDPSEGKVAVGEAETSTVTGKDGSITETTKVENTDGSTTVKEKVTKTDGAVSQKTTVIEKDGTVKTQETIEKANGSKIEKASEVKTNGDFEAKTITTNKNGEVTKTVTEARTTNEKNGKVTLETETVKADGTKQISKATNNAEGKMLKGSVTETTAAGKTTTIEYKTKKNGTVVVKNIDSNKSTVIIPGEVKDANGKTEKVNEVTANILSDEKDVTTLVVNKNVKVFEKNALRGSSVTTLRLNSVPKFEKNSLNTGHELIIIVHSKKQAEAVRKQLKTAGAPNAKIKIKK